MRNIQIIVEYDGTNYCGWQVQKNGISIQGKICEAIEQVTKSTNIRLTGSGRTDAGVHALGQSANFITQSTIPISKVAIALNSMLPKDIRIVEAVERDLSFHSRYSAVGKVYQYKILNNEVGSALFWNKVFHVKGYLDIEAMKCAAKHFMGTYDFTGFSSTGTSVENKIRKISKSEIEVHREQIIYTVQGNGFLYNMVRIIVGTLIKVGQGKIDAKSIPEIIKSKARSNAGPTAPANGLYLQKVLYEYIDTPGQM